VAVRTAHRSVLNKLNPHDRLDSRSIGGIDTAQQQPRRQFPRGLPVDANRCDGRRRKLRRLNIIETDEGQSRRSDYRLYDLLGECPHHDDAADAIVAHQCW
jgi:hypothetical protein